MQHYIEIWDRDTIPYSCDRSQGHIPIDSSAYYPVFYTVGLHCQTPTIKPACQAGGGGGQFVPLLRWPLLRPGRDANPRSTA